MSSKLQTGPWKVTIKNIGEQLLFCGRPNYFGRVKDFLEWYHFDPSQYRPRSNIGISNTTIKTKGNLYGLFSR
jgi:hypothetical protein